MSRIDDFLRVLRSDLHSLKGTHSTDELLLAMLVHAAFADGIVVEEEFDLMMRLMPERELGEALMWVTDEVARPMDIDALLRAFPVPTDRRRLIELAEAMVAIDNHIDTREQSFVDVLRIAIVA